MCLIDTKKFRFTIFPKTVYKVVYVEGRCYYSPYRYTHVELMHMQYPSFIDIEPTIVPGSWSETDCYKFGDGFIFGYTDLIETIYRKHCLEKQHPGFKYVIIKGIIPPFTRYAREIYYLLSDICARRIFWFKVI